jgi:hypothetical protein
MSTQANSIYTPVEKNNLVAGWTSRALAEARHRVDQLSALEQRVYLGILFVAALIIRMVALLSSRQISQLPGRQAGADGIEFEQLARALAQGRGYVRPNGMPTAFRAPGFPMFVSVIYRLTHFSVSAATLSFPLIGAAVCVVTYLLAREVVSERVARLSALLSIFYFPAIYLCTIWFSEPLFMLSFALSLWLFLIYLRKGSNVLLAAAGLMFSWSMLVRPYALLMVPVLLLLDVIHSRRRVLTVPLLLLCCFAPISLWTARNYRLYHALVMGTTNGGSTFYGGNNDIVLRVPEHMGGWVSTVHLPGRAQVESTPDEYTHDQVEWKLGKQWVKSHLAEMPLLVGMKIIRFVLPDISSENKKFAILSFITTIPFLPLWILGVRAAAARSNRTVPWFLIHCGITMTVATGVIFWGSPRFRDAAAPLLFVYAGCGLESLLASRTGRSEHVEHLMAAD